MRFDIFLSISQTPDHSGDTPDEPTMYKNFFEQVEAADRLGFGTAWVAQSHLSTAGLPEDYKSATHSRSRTATGEVWPPLVRWTGP